MGGRPHRPLACARQPTVETPRERRLPPANTRTGPRTFRQPPPAAPLGRMRTLPRQCRAHKAVPSTALPNIRCNAAVWSAALCAALWELRMSIPPQKVTTHFRPPPFSATCGWTATVFVPKRTDYAGQEPVRLRSKNSPLVDNKSDCIPATAGDPHMEFVRHPMEFAVWSPDEVV